MHTQITKTNKDKYLNMGDEFTGDFVLLSLSVHNKKLEKIIMYSKFLSIFVFY
jgi:hypothetical protein